MLCPRHHSTHSRTTALLRTIFLFVAVSTLAQACQLQPTNTAIEQCFNPTAPLCPESRSCVYGCTPAGNGSVTATCNRLTGFAAYCEAATCVKTVIQQSNCATDPVFSPLFLRFGDAVVECTRETSNASCPSPRASEQLQIRLAGLPCRGSAASFCSVGCFNASLAATSDAGCGPAPISADGDIRNVTTAWTSLCEKPPVAQSVCTVTFTSQLCNAAAAVHAVSRGIRSASPAPAAAASESGTSTTLIIALSCVVALLAMGFSVVVVLYCRDRAASRTAAGAAAFTDEPPTNSSDLMPHLRRGPGSAYTATSPDVLPDALSPPRGGEWSSTGPPSVVSAPRGHTREASNMSAISAMDGRLDHLDRVRTNGIVLQLRSGRWQRGKFIGKGSSGSVYLCVLSDGSFIALKQLDASSMSTDEVKNLTKELRMMSTLRHENVVRYYYAAYVPEHKVVNLWMEYVHGGSVGALVRKLEEPLRESVAKRYTSQILRGLAFLHEHRIVHRDIKADNILIDTDGRVKLADFGSARELATVLSRTSVAANASAQGGGNTIVGTPLWMAPEVVNPAAQAGKPYGTNADVWSLGITVAEIMSRGTPPWPAFESAWQALFHIGDGSARPELPTHVSPECSAFMEVCTRRDPSQRPSALALLHHPWLVDGFDDTRPCSTADGANDTGSDEERHLEAAIDAVQHRLEEQLAREQTVKRRGASAKRRDRRTPPPLDVVDDRVTHTPVQRYNDYNNERFDDDGVVTVELADAPNASNGRVSGVASAESETTIVRRASRGSSFAAASISPSKVARDGNIRAWADDSGNGTPVDDPHVASEPLAVSTPGSFSASRPPGSARTPRFAPPVPEQPAAIHAVSEGDDMLLDLEPDDEL